MARLERSADNAEYATNGPQWHPHSWRNKALARDVAPHAAGYGSASLAASSVGEEDSDNAVSLPMDYVGQNNKKGERRAVRLDEVGLE